MLDDYSGLKEDTTEDIRKLHKVVENQFQEIHNLANEFLSLCNQLRIVRERGGKPINISTPEFRVENAIDAIDYNTSLIASIRGSLSQLKSEVMIDDCLEYPYYEDCCISPTDK